MKPVNKHTVLKETRENGSWQGYIAPNKVNDMHIRKGWALGMPIQIRYEETNHAYITENSECEWVSLDEVLNEFVYYNCNSELGHTVRFWQD
jgi:hypothetical protein